MLILSLLKQIALPMTSYGHLLFFFGLSTVPKDWKVFSKYLFHFLIGVIIGVLPGAAFNHYVSPQVVELMLILTFTLFAFEFRDGIRRYLGRYIAKFISLPVLMFVFGSVHGFAIGHSIVRYALGAEKTLFGDSPFVFFLMVILIVAFCCALFALKSAIQIKFDLHRYFRKISFIFIISGMVIGAFLVYNILSEQGNPSLEKNNQVYDQQSAIGA